MDDVEIIELFFKRSEQGIAELDRKYGGLCRSLSYNILNDNSSGAPGGAAALCCQNSTQCFAEGVLETRGRQEKRTLYGRS